MRRLILLGGAFAACSLHAHPGHSPLEHGLSHAVFSPHHFLPLLATGTILFVLGKIARRRALALCLKCVGAAAFVVGATACLLTL